uniref:F-box domain-containing protein n=1 Tax=Leersia perrieri TaxID=77586 RepID=A0A0D9X995_9ORYZ
MSSSSTIDALDAASAALAEAFRISSTDPDVVTASQLLDSAATAAYAAVREALSAFLAKFLPPFPHGEASPPSSPTAPIYDADLPSDAVVEILRRLPPLHRRRFRLVCRHWRDLIDDLAPAKLPPAKTLVVANGSGYIFDDLAGGRSRKLQCRYSLDGMVDTCNGLICLCDAFGGVSIVNPVNGDTLAVPRPPPSRYRGNRAVYSFGYHPMTGRHKVVHFPVNDGLTRWFDVVKVFTLGVDATCRRRPTKRGRAATSAAASVDGVIYWVTMDAKKVMLLDLKDERVAAMITPTSPVLESEPAVYHSFCLIEVSMLEGVAGSGGRWIRRYSVQLHEPERLMVWPHFVHGDDVRRKGLQCHEALQIDEKMPGKAVGVYYNFTYHDLRTFVYVETTEPLNLPSDTVADIMRLIPPLHRRRFRLVCRHWRDLIDDRAPLTPPHTKTLDVFDDLQGHRSREIHCTYSLEAMVGTCNGLICLCNGGSGIVVFNPATGETLDIPLPPASRCRGNRATYDFAFHPATGRYTVVHFPADNGWTGSFDAVKVFTLGVNASWRDVAAPAGSTFRESCGVVSVDGSTYWVAKDTDKIMSLDLKDECISSHVMTLPAPTSPGRPSFRLTEVYGSLAVATIVRYPRDITKAEVWLLVGAGDDRRWNRQYSVLFKAGTDRQMVWPHFAHGDHVMTTSLPYFATELFVHKLSGGGDDGESLPCREARINRRISPDESVCEFRSFNLRTMANDLRTFAYVETKEPLNVYSPGPPPTKTLVVVDGKGHVFDDLPGGRSREIRCSYSLEGMVGTCNGLICLCDADGAGGIVVANPTTGETLDVPPPPPGQPRRVQLRVPSGDGAAGSGRSTRSMCFTLGVNASWRDVAAPAGSTCRESYGVVSVDGSTYWVSKDTDKLMSLDLKDDLILIDDVITLPAPASPSSKPGGYSFRLTEVHGRLAVAAIVIQPRHRTNVLVWVREGVAGGDRRLSRRYSVLFDEPERQIVWPHFAHGDHVLTTSESWYSCSYLFVNKLSGGGESDQCREARINGRVSGKAVGEFPKYSLYSMHRQHSVASDLRTFAYVETTEPLNIIRRLPPLDRRRCRLVCRHWHDVVDSRAPARPGAAKTLVVAHRHIYVFDDLPGGTSRELKTNLATIYSGAGLVGTCNGILCLCDEGLGGTALFNPVTGETLRVPSSSSSSWSARDHKAYRFAHHPTTGRYKIVHFPVSDRCTGSFDVVRVFTLGENEYASWRDVPAPAGSSRRKSCGFASVDGVTYWVAKDTEKLMSFDLKDERFASVIALPAPASEPGRKCCLVEAHGRVAVAAIVAQPTNTKTEVWVLEGGAAGGRKWSRQYSVQVHGANRQMVWPHFAHGDHALTASTWRHARLQCREARINEKMPGKAAGKYKSRTYDDIRTFAYVETNEPLNVYKILRRLPPLDRRRCRLVCRHWHDTIDSRAPARPGRAKTLVVAHGKGYVFDDLPGGTSRPLPSLGGYSLADLVGTCNGILCLTGNGFGGFVLANPFTGEALRIPIPTRRDKPWKNAWMHRSYSFAYHQATGRYKIVHFPVYDRWTGSFDVVKVFTLGEDVYVSWRDVPAPAGSSMRKGCGFVSVDGVTYWVAMDTEKVMSLDLGNERFEAVITLPAPASEPGRTCRLVEAHGRLAVAAIVTQPTNTKTEAWVLEGGAGGRRWSRRYSVQLHGPDRQMVWPHFAHGDHVLAASTWQYSRENVFLYCREARVNEKMTGKAVGKYGYQTRDDLRAFAYVETTEPLNVYIQKHRTDGHG